jgi:hypothetical protein
MAFVHPANLPLDSFVWAGDDYDQETGIYILLHYTHTFDTRTCVERFADGDDDVTFRALFEDILGGPQVVARLRRGSRREQIAAKRQYRQAILRPLAIANYLAWVFPDGNSKIPEKCYHISSFTCRANLNLVRPKRLLLSGRQRWEAGYVYPSFGGSLDIVRDQLELYYPGEQIPIERVDHPYSAWCRHDFTEIQTAWSNLQASSPIL